jgi:PAS domain S-box-containing protein
MSTKNQRPALAPLLETPETAARLAGILTSAMDAIVTVDEAQQIMFYNPAAEKIFGWPVAQMLGQSLSKLLPDRFQAAHAGHMARFGSTGSTSRRMGGSTLVHGLRANGEEFPIEASISQLDTAHGKLFTVILRDVSERVRAADELNALATHAHAARESEKSRVARELHDELAQSLTALKMDANWVREHVGNTAPAVTARINDMLVLLDGTVAATRRIAADLRPLLLDDLGLVPAIEWLVHNFIDRTGLDCTLVADEGIELREPFATAVFRIVQESLANVAKHANASQVAVRIDRVPGAVSLSVQDNGQGFSLDAPRKAQSMGLMGLRERAYLLKGSVDITSQPGQGTRIDVTLPVHESAL